MNKDKKEFNKIKALPIKEKIKLLEQKKYRDLFLNNGGNVPLKKYLIKRGLYVDRLKNSRELELKLELIKNGYFLDKFKDDKVSKVRLCVAKSGNYLEQLKSDSDWRVRYAAAKHGFYDDKYIDTKTVQNALIFYYLGASYPKNIELCRICGKSGKLYYDGEISTCFWWLGCRCVCDYKMEHSVLSRGFVEVTRKELLDRAICFSKVGNSNGNVEQKNM